MCQRDHRFPSLFMSNYTISRLLLSLPTPSDCRIVRQMYFHTRMPPSPTGQKNNQEHLAFVFQCKSAFIPGSNDSAVVRDLSASAPTGSDGNTTPRWTRLRLSPTFSPTRCCDARWSSWCWHEHVFFFFHLSKTHKKIRKVITVTLSLASVRVSIVFPVDC